MEQDASQGGSAYPGYPAYGYGSPYGYPQGGGSSRDRGTKSVIRGYLDVLRRRWWTVLTVLAVAVTIGAVRAFRAPSIYRATAKLIVERHSPQIMNIGGIVDNTPMWDPDYYKTQIQLITSRAVMEEAVKDPEIAAYFTRASTAAPVEPRHSALGDLRRTLVALLGGTPSGPPEPWQILKGMVSARHVSGSHFIFIESNGGDPLRVARVVNATAKAFSHYQLEQKVEFHGEAFQFLKAEQAKEEGELRKAEQALQAFRKSSKAVSVDGSEKDQPLLKRFNELNAEITATQLERIDLTAQMRVVDDILHGVGTIDSNTVARLLSAPGVGDQSAVAECQARLTAAQKHVEDLSRTYGRDHPRMKAGIDDVRAASRDLERSLQQAVQAMANRVETLKTKESELSRELTEQKTQALDLSREMVEYNRLKNEVDRHSRLFDVLVERMREVDVSSNFVRTNVQLAETAETPKAPVSPKRARTMGWSAVMGLFLGLGLAFFFENLDDAIKTPEDLKECLGVPLLGFVPEIRAEDSSSGARFRFRATVVLRDTVSSVAEAYRSMRTSLFFSAPAGEIKVVALTSCGPSEGKTTTSANLSVTIAKSGKRVVLIDGDLHRPSVHRLFELDLTPGVSDILVGNASLEEALRHLPEEGPVGANLSILTAGTHTPSPGDLLGSGRMSQLVAQLRDRFDWVIIDTPPVLFVSDAGILGTYCDGAILVVKAGKHNGAVLVRAQEQLQQVKAKVIGCVMNQLVVSRLGRYYSSYYHHGYAHYSKDYRAYYYGAQDGERGKNGKRARRHRRREPRESVRT